MRRSVARGVGGGKAHRCRSRWTGRGGVASRCETEDPMPVLTNIEDLHRLYRRRAPKMFYDYAETGSWTEQTFRDNCGDFADIRLRQRVAVDMSGRSTKTTMIGEEVATAIQRVRRRVEVQLALEGEPAVAAILEIPEGTVASRLYHARRALKEALEEMDLEIENARAAWTWAAARPRPTSTATTPTTTGSATCRSISCPRTRPTPRRSPSPTAWSRRPLTHAEVHG